MWRSTTDDSSPPKRDAQRTGPAVKPLLLLALIMLAGLALRLIVWRWREFQALGGDEQEYFDQALILLRDRQYVELRLMRPPLYTLFLAGSMYLVDSLVQNLRLVQALISTATVPLVYLLTLEVARACGPGDNRRSPAGAPLLASGLGAASYTLAANATELLTETLFLFGLTAVFWLLLRAHRTGSWGVAGLAGLGLGALCLVRSVGLPLLPLGAAWLLIGGWRRGQGLRLQAWLPACVFACATLLVIVPWTARNYATYGGLILIDTTGAENLWLDNDPGGREAVKAQLYALGEERLLRQQLSVQRGSEVILADPGSFAAKAWGELEKFFALEQSDDMFARRAIWVSPPETWARLMLGDALWLVILLAGTYGLVSNVPMLQPSSVPAHQRSNVPGLFLPWVLYVVLTTLIFHVELRYRLPLYPVLLPYAALTLVGSPRPRRAGIVALAVALACVALTLLHTNYPALAWQLGWKHWHLGQAEAALARGDADLARREGAAALVRDERSALARIALARAATLSGDNAAALTLLDAATAAVRDHPQAHVLRGDLRRALGDLEGAQADLAFESASRQDLQRWLWQRAATPPSSQIDLGDGLDLGFVRGLHARTQGEVGYRWTEAHAELRLAAPAGVQELLLRLDSGRPAGSAPVPVEVWTGGRRLAVIATEAGWQEVIIRLPERAADELIIEVRAPTFTPRDFDPASPDGRWLGVKIDRVELRQIPG